MTREEVAKACGLEDPHEYRKRTGKGRTVAMLCEAVAAASLGQRVFILAFRERYAQQLCVQARLMARRCGVDDALFAPQTFEWDPTRGTRGMRNWTILGDHYRPR